MVQYFCNKPIVIFLLILSVGSLLLDSKVLLDTAYQKQQVVHFTYKIMK